MAKKDFKCPFNEQCEITTVTRRFCQKCRLEKCFSIGMKKDHIMSDEEKIVKRQKIEENRAKRKSKIHTFLFYVLDKKINVWSRMRLQLMQTLLL